MSAYESQADVIRILLRLLGEAMLVILLAVVCAFQLLPSYAASDSTIAVFLTFLCFAPPLVFLIRLFQLSRQTSPRPKIEPTASPHEMCGQGTQVTDPVDLRVGNYQLTYRSSGQTAFDVTLINLLDGNPRPVAMRCVGIGTCSFVVPGDDRYVFQITVSAGQPLDWVIEIEPINPTQFEVIESRAVARVYGSAGE